MNLEVPFGVTATIAVISTLAFLAKTGVGEAIRHKFRKDQARHAHELSTAENALLEEIRKLNTQLQAVQGTANAALIEGQRVAAEWRIKAVDEFWRQWVEETQKTPLQVQLWGSSDEESRVAIFLSDPKMRTLMKDYALPADRALDSDMESTRPFRWRSPPCSFPDIPYASCSDISQHETTCVWRGYQALVHGQNGSQSRTCCPKR